MYPFLLIIYDITSLKHCNPKTRTWTWSTFIWKRKITS